MNDKRIEIKDDEGKFVGTLIEFTPEPGSIVLFQLNRETHQLSNNYVAAAMAVVDRKLPKGISYMAVASDINVFELTQADAVILKLKGYI